MQPSHLYQKFLPSLTAMFLLFGGVWLAPAYAQDNDKATESVTVKLRASGFNGDAGALSPHVIEQFGLPPAIPDGALDDEIVKALESVFGDSMKDGRWTNDQSEALQILANSEDPRLAWLVSDLMRIVSSQDLAGLLAAAITSLLGIEFPDANLWGRTTDHLIAWNIPEPPGYLAHKRNVYTLIEPSWEPLFIEGDIDWRHVSWGGVRIDDRPYDTTDNACNCIPAADNPPVSSAADTPGESWKCARWSTIRLAGAISVFPIAPYAVRLKPISPINCLRVSSDPFCVHRVC